MLPIKAFRFVRNPHILAALITVCGSQLLGQSLGLGTAPTTLGPFVTFDVPGAALGTAAAAINNGGIITGCYLDSFSSCHGFVRNRDGTFVTFDPQDAIFGTFPSGINSRGQVTGNYADPNTGASHGFLRQADGSILTFDPPGSVQTNPTAINEPGEITGNYAVFNNSQLQFDGFLRAKDGTLATIDVPGAGTGSFQGTFPSSLNPAGTITGFYGDAQGVDHGFVRASDGTLTTFDPAGSMGLTGSAVAISPDGTIAGSYFGVNGTLGFVRAPNGAITSFSTPFTFQGFLYTNPLGINAARTITGFSLDANGAGHGFLRTSDGTLTTFEVPGGGTGNAQGTWPFGVMGFGFPGGAPINNAGAVTGYYVDATNTPHGFLLSR